MTILQLEFAGQPLDNRLATVSAGVSLTSIFFVILTGQVGRYLWKTGIRSRDSLWVKGVVIFIWMIQALEFALACHMTAAVHNNDSSSPLDLLKGCLWEMAVYIATCAITECLVHAYFISRIYILEISQCHVISIILWGILILEGAFGLITTLSFATFDFQDSKYVVISWMLPVWLGLSILEDILIAGSIYYLLNKDGPFISARLYLLVKKLGRFCLQTGLITSLVTGVTMVLWIIAQLDLGHLLMCFPLGSIYAVCFMANLIARESYFHHAQFDDGNESLNMSRRGIIFVDPESFAKGNKIISEEMK